MLLLSCLLCLLTSSFLEVACLASELYLADDTEVPEHQVARHCGRGCECPLAMRPVVPRTREVAGSSRVASLWARVRAVLSWVCASISAGRPLHVDHYRLVGALWASVVEHWVALPELSLDALYDAMVGATG